MADIDWTGMERFCPLLEKAISAHPGISLVGVGLFDLGNQFGFCLTNGRHRRATRLHLDTLEDMEIKLSVDQLVYEFELDMLRENFPSMTWTTERPPPIECLIGMDDPNG